MESTIKLQQIEDTGTYVRVSYELTVAGENIRRTANLDRFVPSEKTKEEIITLVKAGDDEVEINKQLARVKESKAGRYYPTASGEIVPMGGDAIPVWRPDGGEHVKDSLVLHKGRLHVVSQTHNSQSNWAPDVAVSLFAIAQILGSDTPPEWVQPDGADGPNLPYSKEAVTTWVDKTWMSDVDGNVWEPGVSQWTEVEWNSDTSEWVPVVE